LHENLKSSFLFFKVTGCSDKRYLFEIKDILEMEMKLLEALDYYLIVYHPYRPLLQYTSFLPYQHAFIRLLSLGKVKHLLKFHEQVIARCWYNRFDTTCLVSLLVHLYSFLTEHYSCYPWFILEMAYWYFTNTRPDF
jgi:hypothetical protein